MSPTPPPTPKRLGNNTDPLEDSILRDTRGDGKASLSMIFLSSVIKEKTKGTSGRVVLIMLPKLSLQKKQHDNFQMAHYVFLPFVYKGFFGRGNNILSLLLRRTFFCLFTNMIIFRWLFSTLSPSLF